MSLTSSSASAQKQGLVLKYLRQKILSTVPGGALPGIRRVMSDCGTGQVIVQRAVAQLHAEGLVETSSRRGIFRSRQAVQPADLVGTLDVIYCKDQRNTRNPDQSGLRSRHSFHSELLEEITRLCGQRWQGVRVSYLGRGCDRGAFEEVVSRRDCHACIVAIADRSDLEAEVFAPHHVPVVHMLPACPQPIASSVTTDAHQVVGAQLAHLWELGHQRIGYLHLVEPALYQHTLFARREQYYRLMAERGLTVQPEWVQFGGWDSQTTAEALRVMLQAPQPPTAVVAADQHLMTIYQVLQEHGLRPGRQFGVVGTDDLPHAALMHPPATSLAVDRHAIASMTLDLLDRKIDGQSASEALHAPVELAVRASTVQEESTQIGKDCCHQ